MAQHSVIRTRRYSIEHAAERARCRIPVPEQDGQRASPPASRRRGEKETKIFDPHRPAHSIRVFLCAEVPAGTSPAERANVAHWNCFLLCTAPIKVGERTDRMKGTTSKAAHDRRREQNAQPNVTSKLSRQFPNLQKAITRKRPLKTSPWRCRHLTSIVVVSN